MILGHTVYSACCRKKTFDLTNVFFKRNHRLFERQDGFVWCFGLETGIEELIRYIKCREKRTSPVSRGQLTSVFVMTLVKEVWDDRACFRKRIRL